MQRVGQYVCRRVHQGQQPGYQGQARNGGYQGGNQTKEKIRMDGPLGAAFIPGTKVPGNDHAAADTNAAEKSDDEESQVAAAAHRGEGTVFGKVANDPGIGHVVKLLQGLSQKKRQGKPQDGPRNRAGGQGLGSLFMGVHFRLLKISSSSFWATWSLPIRGSSCIPSGVMTVTILVSTPNPAPATFRLLATIISKCFF